MGGIEVPTEYKHLMRAERQETEDYKPVIRRHVLQVGSREPITMADFKEATGTTSAMGHVKKLMRQGFLTRRRVLAGRGKRYAYKWHDEPLEYRQALMANGEVVSRDLNLPKLPAIDNIRDLFFDYTRHDPSNNAGKFVLFVEDHLKEVQAERDKLLKEAQDK